MVLFHDRKILNKIVGYITSALVAKQDIFYVMAFSLYACIFRRYMNFKISKSVPFSC